MLLIRIHAERPLLEEKAPPPTYVQELLAERSPRTAYRWAIAMGWDPAGAGTLAAFYAGIRLFDEDEREAIGWSLAGVEQLRFLRSIVRSGRLAGDTEA